MFILSKTYQSIPLHFAHWRTAAYKPEDLDGLAPGDLALKINGKEVDERFREIVKYLTGSDDQARRGQFLSILSVLLPNACSLDVQARTGAVRTLAVERTAIKVVPQTPRTESRWIEAEAMGYIKIPSFGSPAFENEAIEQLKAFKNALTGLKIDWKALGLDPAKARLRLF